LKNEFKKKQYFAFKITSQNDYIDVSKVQNLKIQSSKKFEINSEIKIISHSKLTHETSS